MRYLIAPLFMTCLFLSACGSGGDCQSPANNDGTESSEGASDNSQENNETETSSDATDNESEWPGSSATSCGSPDQGLEPVDCTMHGDTDAFCVYSNHCHCNTEAGFECEEPLMSDWEECAPGSTCIPIEEQ